MYVNQSVSVDIYSSVNALPLMLANVVHVMPSNMFIVIVISRHSLHNYYLMGTPTVSFH